MPHYPNRKFKKCILCQRDLKESGRLTKEHVFGDGISRKIPTVGNYKSEKINRDGTKTLKDCGCPFSSITMTLLCERCNGDLGRLVMNPVTDLIVSLCSGKKDTIQKYHLKLIKQYFSRLGMLIDIASSNYDVNPDELSKFLINTNSYISRFEPIITDNQRKEFIDNLTLPPISVQVASFKDDCEVGKVGKATLRNIGFDLNTQYIPKQKEFLMVYHHLAFIVAIGDNGTIGHYPGFEILPTNHYKDKYKLSEVNALQLNNLFKNTMINEPKKNL
jgi:hypothetical protein